MIACKKEAITKELVDEWMKKWEMLRQGIHQSHTIRDGKAKEMMLNGIKLMNLSSLGHLMARNIY